jgi:phosphate transport system protein
MGTETSAQLESAYSRLVTLTIEACDTASAAAGALLGELRGKTESAREILREKEERLDTLDREINEGVTTTIAGAEAEHARQLLACLKIVNDLERVGDLLLIVANHLHQVRGRIAQQDLADVANMMGILERMLRDDGDAFRGRKVDVALNVLRADAEIDRLRNLVFLRNIENPEPESRQNSFHVVLMTQAVERSGDHAKNVAEEVIHLSTGRSVRHLLRSYDKPVENMFIDYLRKRSG